MHNILWDIKTGFWESLEPAKLKLQLETKWIRNGQKAKAERVVALRFPPQSVGEKIFLADFGLALKAGDSVVLKTQGILKFVSPERLHGYDPSPASDVWSFMVVFYYLYTGYYPFWSPLDTSMGVLQSIVDGLGPLPESWAERNGGYSQSAWYGPSKEYPKKGMDVPSRTTMRGKLPNEGSKDVKKVENENRFRMELNKHAVEFIQKVFRYSPQERPTASQLLEDHNFKEVMRMCGVA